MNSFYYPNRSIASLYKLAIALGIPFDELHYLSEHADDFYFKVKSIKKADGALRETYDVKDRLKCIHAKLVSQFFHKIDYPVYLQGGIKKRDYLSNTSLHTDKSIIITEDITNFFPSVSRNVVYKVWSNFFKFSHEVSECLTQLVTYKGFLVQGSKVSGYLCNLIFWKKEQLLVESLHKQGIVYSRYVDDITVSSSDKLTNEQKTRVIGEIYKMLHSLGVKPNRKKHRIMLKGNSQKVHRVNVVSNNPTFNKNERNIIRAAVHECEIKFPSSKNLTDYVKLFNSTMGRVKKLKRLHKSEADKLLLRLETIKPTN